MEEQAPFWAPKGGTPKGGAPKGGAPKAGGIFSYTPEPHVTFCPIFVHHFFPCLNSIFKNGSFLSVVALVSQWSWPTLAKPTLANFGVGVVVVVVVLLLLLCCCFVLLFCVVVLCCCLLLFCCVLVLCVVVLLCIVVPTPKDPKPFLGERAGPTCSGFGVVVVVVVGLDFPGPPSAGPPLHWTPPPDRPKFRSFSSLSRHRFAVSVSLWGFSR